MDSETESLEIPVFVQSDKVFKRGYISDDYIITQGHSHRSNYHYIIIQKKE